MVINARLCIVQIVFGDATLLFCFPLVQSGSKISRFSPVASVPWENAVRSFEIAFNVLFRVVGRTHQH
jgi:hypothetical protein